VGYRNQIDVVAQPLRDDQGGIRIGAG
jgi:hypothetical protein